MHPQERRDETTVVIAGALALFALVLSATAAVGWFLHWAGAGDETSSPLALGGVLVAVILGVRFIVQQRPPGQR